MIQTNQRMVIHATGVARAWCPQCGTQQEFVTLQTAALITNSMLLDLADGSLPQDLHISPASEGSPRVCLESLRQMVGKLNEPYQGMHKSIETPKSLSTQGLLNPKRKLELRRRL